MRHLRLGLFKAVSFSLQLIAPRARSCIFRTLTIESSRRTRVRPDFRGLPVRFDEPRASPGKMSEEAGVFSVAPVSRPDDPRMFQIRAVVDPFSLLDRVVGGPVTDDDEMAAP